MIAAARDLGMEPLVETHSDEDLDRVLATDARMMGVNARDLETLEVDVAAARGRIGRIGEDRIAVFESGIRTRARRGGPRSPPARLPSWWARR